MKPFPSPRVLTHLLAASLMLLPLGTTCRAQSADILVEKPYIQLGDAPRLMKAESLALLWQTVDEDAGWAVEVQAEGSTDWKKMEAPQSRRVAVAGVPTHRVWSAKLTGLKPGKVFTYRVMKAGTTVFTSTALARKAANQPQRFVVFGDCGQNTPSQKAITYQASLVKPDFVFITGDIVYGSGRASEYRTKYFPIYNAETASPDTGAPLIRSTLFLSSPGNHDILNANMEKSPDTMAYFYYWMQPMNGPALAVGAANTSVMTGPEENQKAFLAAAGPAYPRMANFSFDYGNAHWVVLDANRYVDWTDPALREWVAKDLESAKKATWRFVAFHQPGFNSSKSHFEEQRMRLMADVFEKGKVDIVFNGHVHNYQRSYPMTFAVSSADLEASRTAHKANGPIGGQWTLDKEFDGQTKTKAKGVIYIVTGGGGAGLYNPEQQDKPETWQAFTHKYVADTFSFTVVDIDGKTLTLRQIAADGRERDRFTLTR